MRTINSDFPICSRMIRVVIADNYPVAPNRMRDILALSPQIQIVGETGSGIEAIELVNLLEPDLLILFMELSDLSGLEVAWSLKSNPYNIKILAVSAPRDWYFLHEALEAGVAGGILKGETPDIVSRAVLCVAAGLKHWLSDRAKTCLSLASSS